MTLTNDNSSPPKQTHQPPRNTTYKHYAIILFFVWDSISDNSSQKRSPTHTHYYSIRREWRTVFSGLFWKRQEHRLPNLFFNYVGFQSHAKKQFPVKFLLIASKTYPKPYLNLICLLPWKLGFDISCFLGPCSVGKRRASFWTADHWKVDFSGSRSYSTLRRTLLRAKGKAQCHAMTCWGQVMIGQNLVLSFCFHKGPGIG